MNKHKFSFLISWLLAPHKMLIAFISILLGIVSVLEVASVGALYPVVDSVLNNEQIGNKNPAKILQWFNNIVEYVPISDSIVAASVLLLIIAFTSLVIGFLTDYFIINNRFDLHQKFIDKTYGSVLKQKYKFFTERKLGDIMYIGLNASQAPGEVLHYFPKLAIDLLRLFVTTIFLIAISPSATFFTYLLIAAFGWMIHLLSKKYVDRNSVIFQEASSEMHSLFSESVVCIREIKSYNARKHCFNRFHEQTNKFRRTAIILGIVGLAPDMVGKFMRLGFIVCAIVYVRIMLPERFFELMPVLSVYLVALMQLMPTVSRIGSNWIGVKMLHPRLDKIYEVLSSTDEKIERDNGDSFNELKNGLAFKGANFSYGAKKILNDINLNIEKGSTTALVGESGSGKSTMIDLLLRLREPDTGHILVDSKDYSHLSLYDWRSRVSVVSQEPLLLHESIRENIRLGNSDITESDILNAAKIAQADQFISELKDTYDTVIGDRGMKLSGGQKQRIAIARALARKPDILLLDEATSALDNITEKLVIDSIKNNMKNLTVVMVAHRLSTITIADDIIVLQNGVVVEEGKHDELLRNNGCYYDLYNKVS